MIIAIITLFLRAAAMSFSLLAADAYSGFH